MRWDNAPYHYDLKTFPHHFHKENHVFESYAITFKDIIALIENNRLDSY